jgi:hypothetical protein
VAKGKIAIYDKAMHVKVHDIELGIRDTTDPDAGQPNPIEIRYTQEFEVVVHKTVGQKPITQCTIPDGVWTVNMKFNVLKGANGEISEKLKAIKNAKAGPKKLYTALFPEGLCTYIVRKEITQPSGTDDYYHTVELTLLEANGGD